MTAPESTPLPPADAPEAAAHEAAASAVAPASAPPEPPPRAVWTANPPTAPWCPPEWMEALQRIAPGMRVTASVETSLDTPSDAPSDAPGAEAIGESLQADAWTLVLASRRGRLHAHRGEHREDAGAVRALPTGWVAAVADGAGSAPWSRLGSAIATHVVTETLAARLADHAALPDALRDAATAAHDAMRRFADDVGIPYKALRTTLLLVALDGPQMGVLQVGDGAMALRRRDGTLVHPHAAATGDFSGEVAHFLPDDGALDVLLASLGVHEAQDVDAVLLASDGVEDPWYPFTRHAATLFDVLMRGVNDAAVLPSGLVPAWPGRIVGEADAVHALSEWLAFEKRGENDDRTLCLAYRGR